MKNLAQHILLGLLVLAASLPAPAGACAVLSPEEAAKRKIEALEKLKTDLLALRDEADLVFVGRLAELTFHDETVDADSSMPQVMRMHQGRFDVVEELKGSYPKGQALAFSTNRSRVVIGCGSDIKTDLPKEKDTGEFHLVYAQAGKLLRVNRIPAYQLMNGRQEADFLRGAQPAR